MIGLVLLVVAAGGVIFILPSAVEKHEGDPSTKPPPARAPERADVAPPTPAPPQKAAAGPAAASASREVPTAAEPAESELASLPETPPEDTAKRETERLLDEALKLQARLDNSGAQVWGAERLATSYPEAIAELEAGTSALDGGRHAEAVDRLRGAIAALQRLEANRPRRLERALQLGEAALKNVEPMTATQQFEFALAIEPEHPKAKHGLTRAGNLRRVADLTEAGNSLAKQEKFGAALLAYKQAVAIDPGFTPAHEGLARVERAIAGRDFNRAVSDALAALEQNSFAATEEALSRARTLRPDAPEIDDIRRRLSVVRRTATLHDLRQKARRHAEREEWSKSLESYDAALEIDSAASFAVRGKEIAAKYLQLHDQIDFYLVRPDRLQSSRPRSHAGQILDAVNAVADPGPALAAKRDQLRRLIAAAVAPVAVTLRSDGSTQVTIHRVGRLGAFSERRLELPPGSYTAVGHRQGYRDVRVEFRVPDANGRSVIDIRCVEPI